MYLLNKFAVVVVLYNKEILDSKTLLSFIESTVNFNGSKLVIWNNGPLKLKSYNVTGLVEKGFDVEIKETIENESLAKIYNQFIASTTADNYMILDDDSELNESYLKKVLALESSKIGVPIILFNNTIQGPRINNEVLQDSTYICKSKDKVIAIGSGIVIGHDFVKLIIQMYGNLFDERFYLYGVDTTFFFRVNQLGFSSSICFLPPLSHSLSRLESESKNVREFRVKERAYDVGLQWRYYYPLHKAIYNILRITVVNLFRLLKIKRGPLNLKYILKAYFLGVHYRFKK